MTGPWKHPLSGLSREETGHDGFEKPSSGGQWHPNADSPRGCGGEAVCWRDYHGGSG